MKNRLLIICLLLFSTLNAKEIKRVAFYTKDIAKVSNRDVRIAIKKILDTGSKKLGIELKEEFPESVEEIVSGFTSGKYSLITLNTYDVLQNYQTLFPYMGKIWTIAKKKKSPENRYLILGKKRSSVKKNELLKGGDIALVDFDYMQNLYLDSYLLQNYHESSKTFFHRVVTFSSASSAILKLFFSKVQACVVSEHAYNIAVELNPQLKKSLIILSKSEKIFPSTGLTLSRKGDKKMVNLYNSFANSKQDIKMLSNVLILYKAEAIVYFSKEKMSRLEKFYQHYLALKYQYE